MTYSQHRSATHFLFFGVDQLFVVSVLQFARSLGSGHGGVENKELSTAFCCLTGDSDEERITLFRLQIMRSHSVLFNYYYSSLNNNMSAKAEVEKQEKTRRRRHCCVISQLLTIKKLCVQIFL